MRKQTLFAFNSNEKNIDSKLFNNSISTEFNNVMKKLIDTQINELNTACEQTGISKDPAGLGLIISLYMIRYHGLDG